MHPTFRRILTHKYFLIGSGALIFYTLLGFLILPLIIGWYAPKAVREKLHCELGIEKVNINPFRFTFEMKGFLLKDPGGAPLAGFERLFVNLDPTGVFLWTIRFDEFLLAKPSVNLVIEPDGEINFQKLIPKSAEPEQKQAPPSSDLTRLFVETFSLSGGEVSLTDRRLQAPETLTLRDLTLDLKALSTRKEENGTYSFSTSTSNGESFQWRGEVGLSPLRSTGRLECLNIRIASLWGFLRDRLRLEAPEGKVDVTTDYRLDGGVSPLQLVAENFRVGVSGVALKLAETDSPFFELTKFEVNPVRVDLAARSVKIGAIQIDGGLVRLRMDENGTSNLERIWVGNSGKTADSPPTQPPISGSDQAPWVLDLDSLEIKNFGVDVEDMSRITPLSAGVSGIAVSARARVEAAGSKPPKLLIQQLGAELKDLRAGTRGASEPLFALGRFVIEGGEMDLEARALTLARIGLSDGRITLLRDDGGKINLEQVLSPRGPAAPKPETAPPAWKIAVPAVEVNNLAFGFEELSTLTPFSASVSNISVGLGVEIQTGEKLAGGVKGFSTELKGLRLGSKNAPAFEAQRFFIQGGEIDLGARTLRIAGVGVSDGSIEAIRERDGKLNFEKFFKPKNPVAATEPEKKPDTPPAVPWNYMLKSFEMAGFRTALFDRTVNEEKPLYQFQNFRVRVNDIDGKSPMAVDLGFNSVQGGMMALQAKVDMVAPSVDAKIKISDFSLTPVQPLLDPFVTLAMQSASLSTEGTFRFGIPKDDSKISYDGSLNIDKLNLKEPGSRETFLGWEALRIPKLKLDLDPNRLQIDEVKLVRLLGQLIIAEDGSVNLSKIIKTRKEEGRVPPAQEAEKKESGFPFQIGKIRVEDGNVTFADLALTPKFSTRIHSLKGGVSHLYSTGDTLARIELDGGVDDYGSVKVMGELDLNNITRATDIALVFRNVELASVTPYSGKFAGRRIKSGKLSMDLDYKIKDNRMVGDNKIIVDNFHLGEHVDSPNAINLPLDLAVALMKDADGRIDIGLPVSGDLNDPQFSIGPLLWKAFTNLITKAVTAPFRALGSLFGGGDEKFDAVGFDAGETVLLPPEKEKLKKISEALQKRPQLSLAIQGRYSPESDGLDYKQKQVRRNVARLTGEKITSDEDLTPLDITDSSVRRALEKLFVERFGQPALEEIDRGVKDGTVKPRIVESPEKGKAGKQGMFSKILSNVKLYKLVPGARSPEQSDLLASEVYARLIDSEPVSEQEMLKLAADRAKSVTAELSDICGVPANRLVVKDPEPLGNEEGRGVKLSLEALES